MIVNDDPFDPSDAAVLNQGVVHTSPTETLGIAEDASGKPFLTA
jgi:hypothetical protein